MKILALFLQADEAEIEDLKNLLANPTLVGIRHFLTELKEDLKEPLFVINPVPGGKIYRIYNGDPSKNVFKDVRVLWQIEVWKISGKFLKVSKELNLWIKNEI